MDSPVQLHWLRAPHAPKRIYHYARWHWIAESIKRGSITLNDPLRCWSDPTEWLWTNWIRKNVADTVLCMCWTRTCRSEALWRLERSADEHESDERKWPSLDRTIVRIRSSFDRLNKAIIDSVDLREQLQGKSFLVPIKYLRDHEVERRFDRLANTKGVAQEAAFALSFKRYPYRYEREIRLVHVTKLPGDPSGRTAVHVDPNALIDQIMVDPRADVALAAQVRREARSAGFKNDVLHSRLFELPARLIPHATRM